MPGAKKTKVVDPQSNAKKKPELAPFHTDDASKAFAHFLPLAEALSADEVIIRSADVEVALANIPRAVEAIASHTDRIQLRLPYVAVHELLELPALGLALLHADGRVGHTESTREIDAAFSRVGPLREWTLSYLEIAADLGLVQKERVRAIRSGKGKIDVARDCVDIAGLFKESETKLAGKHPFTTEQLDELAKTGTWLVQTLKPGNAKKTKAPRSAEAALRDRFWKLVEDRYDTLRTIGVTLFGIKHVDDYVPPLFSRVSISKTVEAASGESGAAPG